MQFIKEYLRMIIIRAVNFFPLSEGKNNGCTCLLLLIAIWIQSLLLSGLFFQLVLVAICLLSSLFTSEMTFYKCLFSYFYLCERQRKRKRHRKKEIAYRLIQMPTIGKVGQIKARQAARSPSRAST